MLDGRACSNHDLWLAWLCCLHARVPDRSIFAVKIITATTVASAAAAAAAVAAVVVVLIIVVLVVVAVVVVLAPLDPFAIRGSLAKLLHVMCWIGIRSASVMCWQGHSSSSYTPTKSTCRSIRSCTRAGRPSIFTGSWCSSRAAQSSA